MFVPQKYGKWGQYVKRGFSLRTFLLPKMHAEQLDAEAFLKAARNMFISFDNDESFFLVIAKITLTGPTGFAVCLRMDRDYIEIYKKEADGQTITLASWQGAAKFHGYCQQDLWCNMVALALKKQPS